MTLLDVTGDNATAIAALRTAAERAGMPLDVLGVSDDLLPLYQSRMALIRPDQHVAWRGDAVDDAESVIATVRGA